MTPKKYRVRDLRRYDIGNGRTLVTVRGGAPKQVLPSDTVDALFACTRFEPLAAHAAALAQGGAGAKLETAFQGLAEQGFFRPLPVDSAAGSSAPSKIETVAFPSGNRPDVLGETINQYARHFERMDRAPDFLVVDGSDAEPARKQYRETLGVLAKGYKGRVYYAGPAERWQFAKLLAADGVSSEALSFLGEPVLPGLAYGTARNSVFLHCMGQLALSVDDDANCMTAYSPEQCEGIELYTGVGRSYKNYDPQEFWYFRDRDNTLASVEFSDIDILKQHESMLSQSVSDLVARSSQELRIDRALDEEALDRMLSPSGRVGIALAGLVGDAGWYVPTWLLQRTGGSLDRLVETEQGYRGAITSRELMRVVSRPTITDGRMMQGTIVSFDHRSALPPTLPFCRGEDLVFRLTLRRCFPDLFLGHLPFAHLHARPATEPWPEGSVWQTGGWIRVSDIVGQCLISWDGCTDESPLDRMHSLGTHLMRIGTMTRGELTRFLGPLLHRQKELYNTHLASLLAERDSKPSYWAEDVHRHIGAYEAACADPDFVVPRDLLAIRPDADAAMKLLGELIYGYGLLLCEWPVICAVTAQLADSGKRLGTVISP